MLTPNPFPCVLSSGNSAGYASSATLRPGDGFRRFANASLADTPTVHVVDDEESIRTSLERLLTAAAIPVATYGSAEEYFVRCRSRPAGCLLLDLRLPGLSGIELHAQIRQLGWTIPVIFLTGKGDIAASVQAMKAGAFDFLPKPAPRQLLLGTIQAALSKDQEIRERKAAYDELCCTFGRLTIREKEVARRVAQGLPNKLIADDMGTGLKTTKVHRARALAKLGIRSVAELVRLLKWLDSGPASDQYAPGRSRIPSQ